MKHLLFSFAAAGAATVAVLGMTATPISGQGATGTITGHVKYMGPTPVTPVIRMGADPRCNKLYAGKRPTLPTFVVGADGAFANVLVNVDGSFPNAAVPTTPVVLNQKDCMYVPRVLGARVGQTLQVTNEDPTDHNVHSLSKAGNDFNRSQLINTKPFDVTLKASELLRITCDSHTWMTAFIGIFDHPYFSVSGTDGSFTIANVPAGKQTVKAWHEVMGMQTQMVDVEAGKTTMVDFTFAPGQKTGSIPVHDLVVPMQMAAAGSVK
ncbi:MAG TPA: carboxypeptidase regulatory-like domain-containing protein [Vicinamibacterales bacterium]|jgi:plastocyanin|nr:carboxypeptidase regulatory-like domain-containing protein [Vicinamibacterales bacterium]